MQEIKRETFSLCKDKQKQVGYPALIFSACGHNVLKTVVVVLSDRPKFWK